MDLNFPTAEASVIGSLLIDPDAVAPRVMEQLQPEDFADPTLRHLFEAARDLFLSQKPIDPVTLGACAGVGDSYAKIAEGLMRMTPTAAHVDEYAQILRHNAQLRALQLSGLQLAESRSLDEARQLFAQAAAASGDARSSKCRSWKELASEFFDLLSEEPDEYFDLGIAELTQAAKVQAGQFVVLGAYNSVGKTALSLQMAFGLARSGKRVGYFSLETKDRLLTRRVFAQQAGARMSRIQEHRLRDDEMRRAIALASETADAPLLFFDAAGDTVSDIRAAAIAHRLDAVFVDYAQIVSAPGETPALQVRSVSIALHALAQQLNVAVIALSQVTLPQLNSKGQRQPLRKENLRESAQLANDADVVLLLDLSDPNDYESNRVLMMDKNKDVGQARMLLAFDGPHLRFSYQPPLEDPETAAARERTDKMDKNAADRRAAEAAKNKDAIEGQASVFRDLGEQEGGPLPF